MSSSRSSLPPGFRFHPTDVELLLYYLKRKLLGKSFHFQAIADLDLYKFCPWDLPDKSFLRTRDLEWFFFCPRDRKYTNGPRTNRTTDIGYWKTTGRDRPISHDSHIVGFKKTLVFHIGRAPHGERTNWVMHEYRLQDNNLSDAGVLLDAYVLSKIFEKSGAGPKNGEQHGAPFKEEDWEEDVVDDNSLAPWAPSDTGSAPPLTVGDNANSITESSSRDLPNKCGSSLEPPRRDVSSDTGSAPNKSGPSLELPHRDASSDTASAPSHTVGCNNNTITECSMLDLPNKCGSSLEHPRQDASSDAIVGNLQLSEDLDMETLLACFGDVDELSGSRKDSKKELDSSYCQSNVESSARVDGNDIFSGLEDICPGAELKATVTSYLPNMWEKCVLDQSPLGGDVNYLELNDLDGFMGYPMGGTGCMQTEVDIPRSELEAVDNLCFPNRVDTTSYTELNDSEILLKCPMEANENEKMPYMYRYEPYFGSDTVRPAYGVGSSSKHPKLSETVRPAYGVGSSSKHPKLSGVFHDNLFMSSDDNNGNGFNCSMGI